MRILYSHRTAADDGQRAHIRGLTEALAARGHEIVMVGPPAGGAAGRLKTALPRALRECAEYGYSWPATARLFAAARKAAPDIIYERYNLFYPAGARVKARLGLPLILEVNASLAEERAAHGGLALKGFAAASERRIWRAADRVLPVSGVLAEHVRAAGVPETRITVIHNGVAPGFLEPRDGAAFRARYGLEGALVLGFAGFMRDWHRLDWALRFLNAAGREDLRLVLVGDGPARDALEREAGALGIASRVVFTGALPADAMPDAVAAFDIALQPAATAYASPLKLFEYMALGKAIAAPAGANICEVVSAEEAMLFAPEDEAAFAAAASALVANPALRARLGAAARARLLRDGRSWAENAARVEAIAQILLEEDR